MNFRKKRNDEPEINLIAFIDVLLVVLIFLMLSSTFAMHNKLALKLPKAQASESSKDDPQSTPLMVRIDGSYQLGTDNIPAGDMLALERALAKLPQKDTLLVIHADAQSSHQSVISALQVAQNVGLVRITFATQNAIAKP
jgi:biopolymer transport protein ExbD